MRMTHFLRLAWSVSLLFVLCNLTPITCPLSAQTETATVSGLITDETGAVVPGAEVKLQSVDRGTIVAATTNDAGIYVFASVHPGQYQITVHKPGFKQVDLLGMIVNVQDHIEQNFRLQIGSVAESVTVNANDLKINTTDASVSTVVDRQFAENMPMNGRSFQTLIQLTPGVVVVPSNGYDSGQFSVNGQRAASNYWMVDGVSANVGASSNAVPGNGLSGALPALSAQGGTNSLVSVDALQEFRIQTSTYAPEFGRNPGAQISILTRSGTNQFHGTLFDYLRNDVLDSNNWFANSIGLPKPQERQNDFGGVLGGPVVKDHTFFFFSYEGLRLRLPQTALTFVPDLSARQNATATMQPYLNAFPVPNGPDNVATGIAQFNASFSNASTLDAYSLRVDQKLTNKLTLFGRYNYSPSDLVQRGFTGGLNVISPSKFTIQTGTLGATWLISTGATDDFRFNYSRADASSHSYLDNFGGAVALTSLPFPSPFTGQNAVVLLHVSSAFFLSDGMGQKNVQRQINVVDNVSFQRGSHSLKFGVDFRRLAPIQEPRLYLQLVNFRNVSSFESGNVFFSLIDSFRNATLLFRNLGAFAQDTWRIIPRFTMTYGLRWDVDFAPSSIDGPNFPAVTGFDLNDLSSLALAPAGTPPYKTKYGNFAPRLGLAYEVRQNQEWGTVLRGGFGVFYDLASSEAGNLIGLYPFSAGHLAFGGTFPLSSASAAPPPIVPPSASNHGGVQAFDPNLELPYTLQWNVAVEQGLGRQQTLTTSYIGSAGRRLIQTGEVFNPSANLTEAVLVTNAGVSNYQALQVQFQRRLSHGLQALASYVWSHSTDTASAGSLLGNGANDLIPGLNSSESRGPSDFDIRNAFSVGATYDIPAPKSNAFTSAILRGWSLQNVIQARSAPPVDVFDSNLQNELFNGAMVNVRPDLIPGIPLYLYGSQYPGGKAINNTLGAVAGGCSDGSQSIGPFCPPPVDPNTGLPLRQGDLPRNAFRGFGAVQWDLGIHREFPIHESVKLQFRAELFNVLNHPNFGPPVNDIGAPNFGLSNQVLSQSLSPVSGSGGGAFNPLYQIGGPRSVQLALKLFF